jgi:hypothetical protein
LRRFSSWGLHYDWLEAAKAAAQSGQKACLEFALQRHVAPLRNASQSEVRASIRFMHSQIMPCAASAPDHAILKALHQAGCEWTGFEVEKAALAGNPEVLKFCLKHSGRESPRVQNWNRAMRCALIANSLECVKILYDNGYERHRSHDATNHPARFATGFACLQHVVQKSGRPNSDEVTRLRTQITAVNGEDMLRFVLELGATMHPKTSLAAALNGQAGSLRLALEKGAHWNMWIIVAAIASNSLECVQCAFEHIKTAGEPRKPKKEWDYDLGGSVFKRDILLYVAKTARQYPRVEAFLKTWASRGVALRAEKIRSPASDTKTCLYDNLDLDVINGWTVLYLARWCRPTQLPAPLPDLVDERIDRLAALGGAIYKAGKRAWDPKEDASPSLRFIISR